MTFDDVTGSNVTGQENDFSADGATCSLDFGYGPRSIGLARPEREPRSVRTVEEIAALDPGRDLDLLPSPFAP